MKTLDRLTAADLMMVWPEELGWPEDIGAIAILDGAKLFDGTGRFRIDEVRDKIARRLPLVPRFRQILLRPPLGLGWPLWIDARSVDLAEHLQVAAVASPGGEAELLEVCEQLRRRPFDRGRPLWTMTFLTGLADGKVGLFIKVHHAIADGIAGVATLAAFVDLVPDAPDPAAEPWVPGPVPTTLELFEENLRRRLRDIGRLLSGLLHPIKTTRSLRRAWPAMREALGEGRSPRTSVNRPIGSDRRLAVMRGRLDSAKAIAHAHGGKVNDVLMTAVAGGLRDLLAVRGEAVDGVVLRAFVPVSLHEEGAADGQANFDAAMVVPLPIGEADHIRRFELIAAETAERKNKSRPAGGSIFRNVLLQRIFLHYSRHQRMINFYAGNVPGPPVPVYLAGAPILELFPVVPIMGNMTIGVGAFSYAGQFNFTVVADRDLCPDIDVFVAGMQDTLEALRLTARPAA
jgi:WS/DGAT/MGAT family acyltransferase